MTDATEEPAETAAAVPTEAEVETENEETEAPDDVDVEKDTSNEQDVPVRYNVASYGWDSDVEGLVKRLDRGDIVIPQFQRNYVWKRPEKSRFIESLILGLPIPSIFLSTDPSTKHMNIIDGQQRLLSLQEFLNGGFSLYANDIQPELKGLYFSSGEKRKRKALSAEDRRTLENSLLHAVVIKQEIPDSTEEAIVQFSDAIIQIFRRLNTSGKPLQAQEVRACVYYGACNDMLGGLNQNHTWRALFGREHTRLKDMEAILRYFSLLNNWENYKGPMPGFLNHWMQQNRFLQDDKVQEYSDLFTSTIELIHGTLGEAAFRTTSGTFLLSRFDAVMVGLSKRLLSGKSINEREFRDKFNLLMADKSYIWAVEEFVNDTDRVHRRITSAIEIFG